MSQRRHELARKRQALSLKIQAQRQLFALEFSPLEQDLQVLEKGLSLGRLLTGFCLQHPGKMGALLALITWIKPSRVLHSASKLVQAWLLWDKCKQWLARYTRPL